jgi:hypothetical protein
LANIESISAATTLACFPSIIQFGLQALLAIFHTTSWISEIRTLAQAICCGVVILELKLVGKCTVDSVIPENIQ